MAARSWVPEHTPRQGAALEDRHRRTCRRRGDRQIHGGVDRRDDRRPAVVRSRDVVERATAVHDQVVVSARRRAVAHRHVHRRSRARPRHAVAPPGRLVAERRRPAGEHRRPLRGLRRQRPGEGRDHSVPQPAPPLRGDVGADHAEGQTVLQRLPAGHDAVLCDEQSSPCVEVLHVLFDAAREPPAPRECYESSGRPRTLTWPKALSSSNSARSSPTSVGPRRCWWPMSTARVRSASRSARSVSTPAPTSASATTRRRCSSTRSCTEGHPLVAVRPGPDRGLGLVRERQREVLEDVEAPLGVGLARGQLGEPPGVDGLPVLEQGVDEAVPAAEVVVEGPAGHPHVAAQRRQPQPRAAVARQQRHGRGEEAVAVGHRHVPTPLPRERSSFYVPAQPKITALTFSGGAAVDRFAWLRRIAALDPAHPDRGRGDPQDHRGDRVPVGRAPGARARAVPHLRGALGGRAPGARPASSPRTPRSATTTPSCCSARPSTAVSTTPTPAPRSGA